MPVDDDTLQSKKDAINEKIRQNNTENNRLKQILSSITEIEKIEDPAFPNNPSKKIKPKDRNLGVEITDKRRQDIYDKIISDITALEL